jgi:hypothetical protein
MYVHVHQLAAIPAAGRGSSDPRRQKQALRDAIALARQDPAIMNDPATEPGYLIHRGD